MASLTYTLKYKKNTGALFSPSELQDLYFYGVSIRSKDGSLIPQYIWETQIRMAQEELERYLAIKFQRQLITETLSYYRDDYLNNLPILNTSYPVYEVITLVGMLSGVEQIIYPIEWSNCYQGSDGIAPRRISIVPTGSGTSAQTSVALMGVTAQIGIRSLNIVPNYWTVQYITGFDVLHIPYDLLDIVGKWAAIKMFHIAGDLILGAGIASLSLGIDGLSQSISSTSSATNAGYGARIIGYLKDIDNSLKRLRMVYKGINFAVL